MAETGVRIPVAVLRKSSVDTGLFVVNGLVLAALQTPRRLGPKVPEGSSLGDLRRFDGA